MPTDYSHPIARPHRTAGSLPLVTSALLVAVAALLASGFAAAGASDDGRTTLSSNDTLVGGIEPTSVHGEGYTTCAGREVTVSLIFPLLGGPATGSNPFDSAPRVSPQRTAVDASGGFSVVLPAPAAFPARGLALWRWKATV